MIAKNSMRAELVDDPDFGLLSVDDVAVFAGISLVERHNLNATDSAILALFLEYISPQAPIGLSCLLITADQRFLRAAQAEGLRTLNPEIISAADVPAILAAL